MCHGAGVVKDLVVDDTGGVEPVCIGHQRYRGGDRRLRDGGLRSQPRKPAERGSGRAQREQPHQKRDDEGPEDHTNRTAQEDRDWAFPASPPEPGTGSKAAGALSVSASPRTVSGMMPVAASSTVAAALHRRARAAVSANGLRGVGTTGASAAP